MRLEIIDRQVNLFTQQKVMNRVLHQLIIKRIWNYNEHQPEKHQEPLSVTSNFTQLCVFKDS